MFIHISDTFMHFTLVLLRRHHIKITLLQLPLFSSLLITGTYYSITLYLVPAQITQALE